MIHQVGDSWTSHCKSCTCGSGGKVSCRQSGCKSTCTDERGFVHQVKRVCHPTKKDPFPPGQVGDKWKKDCNTCTCTNGGLAQCTTNR